MPEQELRIAIAQINLLVGDMEGNARRIIEAMHEARDTLGADVLVTPELALTGYPPEDLLLRPGMYERIERTLLHLQKQVSGIDVLLGYPEHTPEGVYNAAALIREGRIIAHARKENLPNYSVFDEKRYFSPEHDSCVVRIKGANVGITICEDVWFPEPLQRLKEAGADLILNINASPYHINKGYERERAVADRCRETGLPVVYANLVGGQDELVFDGDSFVMDGEGTVTRRVPAFIEKLEQVRFVKDTQGWQPVQADALPAPLSTTASVYQALVLGVRDFVRKNGFNGAVIGLSGGIDSALTLAIAVDALGNEEIEAVMMPSRYTADMSVEDAAEQARTLGVNYRVIAIEQPFNAFLDILADEFAGLPVDTTEENIQARCRGVLLMAISNKKRKMVLTTGNKSEMAVGYATLYGDMAGGFDVLKDVPKTLVYELSSYRNTLSPVIPQRVIDRPPSAELAPDQKDTDSLPPYDVLDAILEMYVEKDMGLEDIVSCGYDREIVQKIMYMVTRNEYKRRQAPPGIRITRRAFGRDRRYPITSGYATPTR
ncbi:NAD+ synthase [Thiohalophilus sp.]|uniref:NAD+ synthase n=1 Tax=Thiohalophilus sp. TaxID=3028392 RepID=UPI00397698AD